MPVKIPGIQYLFLHLQEYDSKVGNIYTDTVPPWLRSTESDAQDLNKPIGPTLEDLHKHGKLTPDPSNHVSLMYRAIFILCAYYGRFYSPIDTAEVQFAFLNVNLYCNDKNLRICYF